MQPWVVNRSLLQEFQCFLRSYRRIAAELAKPAPRGWLPVLVRLRRCAGIRWLRVAAVTRSEAPEAVTEIGRVELHAV